MLGVVGFPQIHLGLQRHDRSETEPLVDGVLEASAPETLTTGERERPPEAAELRR